MVDRTSDLGEIEEQAEEPDARSGFTTEQLIYRGRAKHPVHTTRSFSLAPTWRSTSTIGFCLAFVRWAGCSRRCSCAA